MKSEREEVILKKYEQDFSLHTLLPFYMSKICGSAIQSARGRNAGDA
jgi:hypothetical protein